VKISPRVRRLRQLKTEVRVALGGKCALCRRRRHLEIDHVEGCTWVQRKLNQEHRWYRYRQELRAGVSLRLLCRIHNAARNQSVHGSISGRLALIPVPEVVVGQVWQVCRTSGLQTNPVEINPRDKFIICSSRYEPLLREWLIEVQPGGTVRHQLPYSWIRACCKLRD
jgi:hypothetical protein